MHVNICKYEVLHCMLHKQIKLLIFKVLFVNSPWAMQNPVRWKKLIETCWVQRSSVEAGLHCAGSSRITISDRYTNVHVHRVYKYINIKFSSAKVKYAFSDRSGNVGAAKQRFTMRCTQSMHEFEWSAIIYMELISRSVCICNISNIVIHTLRIAPSFYTITNNPHNL